MKPSPDDPMVEVYVKLPCHYLRSDGKTANIMPGANRMPKSHAESLRDSGHLEIKKAAKEAKAPKK